MTQSPSAGYHDQLDDLWYPQRTPAAGVTQPQTPGRGIPARPRPVGRGFGRVFAEILLAAVISLATAAAMGWQVLRHLHTMIAGTGVDPFTGIWSLAWSGHALRPGSGIPIAQIFNGNAFFPADYSLAFGDSLLGYGPLTWFVHGAGGLVMVYNLILVFGPALSSLGGYALARQLGANPVGAAVAGAGFAYAPWHTGQFDHLNVLATGPLVIAAALLARGHGLTLSGLRAPSRPLWAFLGWIVAAWQLTIGFALGLPLVYLLAVIAVLVVLIEPVRLLRSRRARRRAAADPVPETRPRPQPRPRVGLLLPADLVGGALFTVTGVLMAYPYFRVRSIDPAAVRSARGLHQVALNSPKPLGLITPPSGHGTWSQLRAWLSTGPVPSGPAELRLLPGAILLALAVLGLLFSTWRWWWRLMLALSAALIAALALGTRFPGRLFPGADAPFTLLWRHAPGWAGDATPGRLMVFATLPIALLAAGAVSRLCGLAAFGRLGPAPRLRAVLFAVLPVLIVLEGWAHVPTMPVPATPRALIAAPGPTVVLPSLDSDDGRVMFWTATRDFPLLADGHSGITPSSLTRMRAEMIDFPDPRSVAYLRANGFRSVAVLRAQLGDTPLWSGATGRPDPSLGLTRTDLGDSVLFTLTPR